MNSILKLMVLAMLVAAASFSAAAEPTLKADLKSVVETGQVAPVGIAHTPDTASSRSFRHPDGQSVLPGWQIGRHSSAPRCGAQAVPSAQASFGQAGKVL